MTESELRAFMAALEIARARDRLTSENLRRAILAWHVLYVFEPERIIHVRQRLDLSLLPPETFRAYFRFSRHHITPLRQMLGIADTFVATDHKIHGDDALLILLSRMASKQRLVDLENRFGLSSAFPSDVTLSLVRSLHAQWFSLLFCAKQCFTADRSSVQVMRGSFVPLAVTELGVGDRDALFGDVFGSSNRHTASDFIWRQQRGQDTPALSSSGTGPKFLVYRGPAAAGFFGCVVRDSSSVALWGCAAS